VWALVAAGLLAAAVALASRATGLLAAPERSAVDARYSIRGSERAPKDIAIVAIDQGSLAYLPRFPFPRTLYAPVLEQLRNDGARAIAFDIEFNRPTGPADDVLINAAAAARPVVFATSLIDQHGGTEVLGGPQVQRQIGAVIGASLAQADSSGVVRRLHYAVRGVPTLPVAIARVAGARVPAATRFGSSGAVIDYLGPAGTFRTYSFGDVLAGKISPSAIAGREVIIGVTAPSLQDLHPSPYGILPGPEVIANALATVQTGFPLTQVPGGLAVAVIVLLALLAPLGQLRGSALLTLAIAGAGFLALTVGAQLAFDGGRILDYSDSLLALAASTGATISVGYVTDNRERRRLREMFAAFTPEVVDRVLAGTGVSGRVGGMALPATAVIGGYQMREVVGRGSMGVVYKATQLALGRQVALKVISPDYAADETFRRRFERESRLAASVEHPNVIPVYEAGEDDGLLYIAMRCVDGIDLGETVARLGPLAPARAVAIVAQVAAALDSARAVGLVHRDVKPANILLTRSEPEHAYLTDFGIAKTEADGDATLTSAGGWVGTLDYIAPEQLRGEDVDGRADIYALGGVLHFVLTGEVPFPVAGHVPKMFAAMNAPPPQPSKHDPRLARLDTVIAKAMAKEPGDRYPTGAALAEAAASAAAGIRGTDPVLSPTPAGSRAQAGTAISGAPPSASGL
jgi:CHASE2 domain-containing sensor protein